MSIDPRDTSDLIVRAPRSRVRIGVGAAVVLVLVGLAVAVLVTALGSHGSSVAVTAAPGASGDTTSGQVASGETPSGSTGQAEPGLYVHVTGAVVRPGLFVLKSGDRALDAIAAAGGFAPDADQSAVNLARPLVDGEQLVVPVIGAAPSAVTGGAASGNPVAGPVNLNTADAAALDTLPGVGPATAKSILDWRAENGRFSTVEDLLSVSGIGEKTFDTLKDLVTV